MLDDKINQIKKAEADTGNEEGIPEPLILIEMSSIRPLLDKCEDEGKEHGRKNLSKIIIRNEQMHAEVDQLVHQKNEDKFNKETHHTASSSLSPTRRP
jgi:hypothetical protein